MNKNFKKNKKKYLDYYNKNLNKKIYISVTLMFRKKAQIKWG